jgi:hypothetical protein
VFTENEIISEIKKQANDFEDRERKEKAEFQLDVFLGAIEPYVRVEMKRFYTKTDDFIVFSSANVAKKSVEQLARLYEQEPTRVFNNCTDAQVEYLETLYKKMQFNQMMLKVNQLYKLSNQTHFQVIPNLNADGTKGLAIRLVPNQNLNVVTSLINPEQAEAYAVSASQVRAFRLNSLGDDEVFETAETGTTYSVWSKDLNFVFNTTLGVLSEESENVIGIVPIIEVCGLKYGTYFKVASESFADFTVQLNTSISDAGQAKRFQGMPIGWVKGTEDQLKDDLIFGPNKLIKLARDVNGTDAEIGFTNPNVDLDKLMNFDMALLSLFLTCADIDPTAINSKGIATKYTSGYEKMLAMIQMFEPSQRDENVFKGVENNTFQVVKAYINTFGGVPGYDIPNVGVIPENANVSITYHRPEQVMSKGEKLDLSERELALGFVTEAEAVASYRGITIDQAEIFIEQQARAKKERALIDQNQGA